MIKFPVIPNTKLYLVGGCVRDYLLGKPFKDRDFVVVTPLRFDDLKAQIEGTPGCKVFEAKKEFMTLRCKINDEVVDLVYPRKDCGYSDGRHPDSVESVDTLKEDASRRDFTINAMYMSEDGNILDFFSGQDDLDNKVIRTVGKPSDRFKEDYLRILRAVRFECELGFEIPVDVTTSMIINRDGLKSVSVERVREELNKALLANPFRAFERIFYTLGLDELFLDKGLSFEVTLRKRKFGMHGTSI